MNALILALMLVFVHDDGRYANSPLKPWFDKLANGHKELCCSIADGRVVEDPDIDMTGAKCAEAICVRIDGQWLPVYPWAVVTEPNRAGPAMVWPAGQWIRCFLPGAGA